MARLITVPDPEVPDVWQLVDPDIESKYLREVGMVEKGWAGTKPLWSYEWFPNHAGGWRDACCFIERGPYAHKRTAIAAARREYERRRDD